MATRIWEPKAIAVAQVDTVQVTAYDVGTTYILTIHDKTVSTIAAGSVNDTATALAAAWNASTEPEFAEVTASAATDTVTLTADTEGYPFTATSSVSGGAGTIGAVTSSTANAGPNVWAAINFSGATLPVNGDTIIFENSNVDCLYNIDQSAIDVAKFSRKQSYTGKIGLPNWNANGYSEYRPTYLMFNSVTTLAIGEGEGNGSRRTKIDTGSNAACALTVYNSGTRAEAGIPSILWKGGHADNTVTVLKGDLGIAIFGSETAVISTLEVGYLSSQGSDSNVVAGDGLTLTTVNVDGGYVELYDNITTLSQTGGTVVLGDAATVTTYNLDAGTAYYRSTGTLTTLNVGGGGIFDVRQDMGTRTVTNCNLYEGAVVHDPSKTVTWTNGLDLVRCSPTEVTLDIGRHQTLTPSAI